MRFKSKQIYGLDPINKNKQNTNNTNTNLYKNDHMLLSDQ